MVRFRGVMPCLSRRLGLHFCRHLAVGGLRVLRVTGSHHSLLGKKHVDSFVPTFTRVLDAASRRSLTTKRTR